MEHHPPPDAILLRLSLQIAADRIATDPLLRDTLRFQLPPQYATADPDDIARRLIQIYSALAEQNDPAD